MNETAVAKASGSGNYFVATGVNTIAERAMAASIEDTIFTTSSTSYTGTLPSLSIAHGAKALVFIYGDISVDTNSTYALMSFDVSGSATIGTSDSRAIGGGRFTVSYSVVAGSAFLITSLPPGTSTFAARYKVTSAATGTFNHRRILVLPF